MEIKQDKNMLVLKGKTKATFENINAFKGILIESGYFKNVKVESANVIKELAIKQGMNTMIEDGFRKIKQGGTTIEEVLRVIHE